MITNIFDFSRLFYKIPNALILWKGCILKYILGLLSRPPPKKSFRVVISLTIFCFSWDSFAHSGSTHPPQNEQILMGFPLIILFFLSTTIYFLFGRSRPLSALTLDPDVEDVNRRFFFWISTLQAAGHCWPQTPNRTNQLRARRKEKKHEKFPFWGGGGIDPPFPDPQYA